MGHQLTVRNVSPELDRRLRDLSEAKGQSVNSTVLELLESGIAVEKRLDWYAEWAEWTEEDAAKFDEVVAWQRTVDARDWE